MVTTPSIPASFDEARSLLTARPVGRTPWALRALRLAGTEASGAIDALQPVGGDVFVGVILDLPDTDVAVSEEMLRSWGVSLEDALAAAVANRAALSPQVQAIENVHLVTSMPYAAYALRVPEAVAGLVAGRTPVVLVPTQGQMIVANAEDPSSVALAARVADRILQSDDRGVSVSPLVREGDGWAPLTWPAEATDAAQQLQRRWDVAQYAVQRPLLQRFYAAQGQEYAISEAALAARDGRTMSYTSLTEGVSTILPWVDAVDLVSTDGAVTQVPMSALSEAQGVLQRMPDTDPVLVFASRFPEELVGRS